MSELGRPFGLTFEDRDEPAPLPVAPLAPAAPAVPDVGRPFDMNFGEAVQNGGAIDAASGAAPPATPEPVAAADGVTGQPVVPQAAPNAGEPGAMAAAESERERRLVQSKAEYEAYLQKVMYAAGRMATDDGRAALIHDIIRHKGLNTVEGYDQVDRNFLSEERDYRRAQPYDGNQRQKFMVNGDRTTASLVRGDEAAMNDTDAKLKNVGFLLERDPYGEPGKAMINRGRGALGGLGNTFAGPLKFHAGAVVAQEHRILDDMRLVIEGTSRRMPYTGFNGRTFDGAPPHRQTVPFRRDALTHPKVREFLDASPQEQAKLYEEQRLLVENMKITDDPAYKLGKGIEAWTYNEPDAGFEREFNWGRDKAKGVVQGGAAAFTGVGGILFAIASEAGHRTGEAVEHGATPEQYLKIKDRATTNGIITSFPVTKMVGDVPGVGSAVARLETYVGPGGKRVMKWVTEGGEAIVSGQIESDWNDKDMKAVLDPKRDTSSGALQSAIRKSVDDAASEARESYELPPLEVYAARARATNVFADKFADAVRGVQHGMRLSASAGALSQYVDISVPDRDIAMPVAEIERLQKIGKITPQTVAQWGVQDQIDKSGGKGDVVIPLRSFMKARLAPESVDDVARSVRFGNGSFTGHQAAEFGKQRDAALAALTARMKVAKPVPDEGAFIFTDASNRLRQAGLSDEEAERRATLIVDALIDKARQDKSGTTKLDADDLYYREVSRADAAHAGASADAKFKQDYEAFSKRRGK